MAYSQVIPKENPARQNKQVTTVLARRNDGELIGPELHWTVDWHPKTRDWWDSWRRHELAPVMEESDWEFLQDTAFLHHRAYTDRTSIAQVTAAMAEIRQRVSKFGATFEDRLKLRIKFADTQIAEDKAANGPQVAKRVNYAALMDAEEGS
jgi:hypothetical protein